MRMKMRIITETEKHKKRHWSLDSTDVTILDALATIGPRNVHEIARQLKIPVETAWYRIKRLYAHFSMFVQANVYHTNIGLRKVLVLAEAFPGFEDMLYEAVKANEYWIYTSQCFGGPTKCLGIYAVPNQNVEEFKDFVTQLEEVNIAKNTQVYWSTCFQTVNLTPTWFNTETKSWGLLWNEWVKEVENNGGKQELPFTLVDPEEYPQKADYMDIFILKELEKKATIRFSELAKMLGTSIQNVRYHYEAHVIQENLLEGWQILVPHFGKETADKFFFIFEFDNSQNLKCFAVSLLDKPFARTVGKVYGENKLFIQIYLPRREFGEFLGALSKLVKNDLLRSYSYFVEDSSKSERQTISYKSFKKKVGWIYDHKEYLKRLQIIVNRHPKRSLS